VWPVSTGKRTVPDGVLAVPSVAILRFLLPGHITILAHYLPLSDRFAGRGGFRRRCAADDMEGNALMVKKAQKKEPPKAEKEQQKTNPAGQLRRRRPLSKRMVVVTT